MVIPPSLLFGSFWTLTSALYSSPANRWFLRDLNGSAVAHNLTRFVGSLFLCWVCCIVERGCRWVIRIVKLFLKDGGKSNKDKTSTEADGKNSKESSPMKKKPFSNTAVLISKRSDIIEAERKAKLKESELSELQLPSYTPFSEIRLDKLHFFLRPALCMVTMNICNSLALSSVGVTLTYVIKSTIPVWACIYSRFSYLNERFSYPVIFSLLLSCIGVVITNLGDTFNFRMDGFIFGCLSCIGQTAFVFTSKSALKAAGLSDYPMHGFATSLIIASSITFFLYVLENYCDITFIGIYLEDYMGVENGRYYFNGKLALGRILGRKRNDVDSDTDVYSYSLEKSNIIHYLTYSGQSLHNIPESDFLPLRLLLHSFLSYFLEYSSNFLYTPLVTPLTVSITDIVRRMATVLINTVTYGYQIDIINGGGMILSLTGAVLYCIAIAPKDVKERVRLKMSSLMGKKSKSKQNSGDSSESFTKLKTSNVKSTSESQQSSNLKSKTVVTQPNTSNRKSDTSANSSNNKEALRSLASSNRKSTSQSDFSWQVVESDDEESDITSPSKSMKRLSPSKKMMTSKKPMVGSASRNKTPVFTGMRSRKKET